MVQMKRKKQRSNIVWILLTLALAVISFSGYQLWKTQQIYLQGDRCYEELTTRVRNSSQEINTNLTSSKEPQVEIPSIEIDFATLQQINADAIAWLYSPDTVIDYPVMKAFDYNWYLYHLPDGTYNANGTLFLDYNHKSDFSGKLSIIYGHNMKSSKMFGSLTEYKNQNYFENHPYLYLYTADSGNYKIELLYGFLVSASEWQEQAFMYEENLTALLTFAKCNTTFESNVEYEEESPMIVLSTCSYEFDDARYVVIGKLVSEYAKN